MGDDDLPVFVHWEQTLGEILDRTGRFPKSVRFTLAERIDVLALEVLEHLVEARYSRSKAAALTRAGLAIEKIRLLCRVAHDRGHLDHRGYEVLSRRRVEAGAMVGGWRRSRREREA